MATTAAPRPHSFHIPVMGTGFMIDAPLRIAKYGISTVLSLVDDVLIEQMRKFHSQRQGEPYEPITAHDEDARAHRITAYLNFVDRLVHQQVARLQASPFEAGSEITRYYELLPETPLSRAYREMLATTDPAQRTRQQQELRQLAVPGSIDVNIMAKGDREPIRHGEKLPPQFSDASAALRGYALSTLRSSIVFSAGINPRLYSYIAEFPDFFPDASGELKKQIILKVSDFRSAEVQGKFLAKRGLWVSEYRIESGLNCGGHAFPTKGLLLGPILEELHRRKAELIALLHRLYSKALAERGRAASSLPPAVRVTFQGGLGTGEEDQLLRDYYHVDGTGWGTPFLLVPEVTNVDDEHLRLLCDATDDDVFLSDNSPFGLPFWNLRSSASEQARRRRIEENHPGSPCPKGFVKLFNTEFTTHPICVASRQYQQLKLKQLKLDDLPEPQRTAMRESVMAKSCICHDLAGVATLKLGIDPAATPAVCCGPNIVNFSQVHTLEEMVGNIYGRVSLITNPNRPHVLLRELALYIDYMRDTLQKQALGLADSTSDYWREFKDNLLDGIDHYRRLAGQFVAEAQTRFLDELESLRERLDTIPLVDPVPEPEDVGQLVQA